MRPVLKVVTPGFHTENIPELSWGDHLLELKCILPEILRSLLHRGGFPPDPPPMKSGEGLFSAFPPQSPSRWAGRHSPPVR
ncbi:hypothetical protein J2129_001769 [Methanofollis sp. W23]|nr:hypothetical protein [Methanofollis sp. W23]